MSSHTVTGVPGRLTLVPIGGLCNRLRALLSVWHLGELLPGCRMVVEWPVNRECRADFSDLFRQPGDCPWQWAEHRPWNAPALKGNLYLPALVRRLLYDRRLFAYVAQDSGQLQEWLRGGERVWICSGSSFSDYPSSMARRLRPAPEVQVRIEALTRQFGSRMIGVHIRRTDNLPSIRSASVDDFRRRMRRAVAENADTRFYLATDDAHVKEALCREFAGRVVCQQTGSLRRDTLDGMREAVADLYALAATQGILGSYWSSFTDMAAEIGGIPVEIVRGK